MRLRQWIAALMIVVYALPALLMPLAARAGNLEVRKYVLFAGDTDSTTQVSRWINIKNASRVYLRAWSTHAGFGANADSTKSDSIATFVAIFTDSSTQYGGLTAGADSVQLSGVSVADSVKMVAMMGAPVNKVLRGPSNGWGRWAQIYATGANSNVTITDGQIILPEIMRLRVTPLRRSTALTSEATVPSRVNGLRGFRLDAYVYYANK